MGALRAVYDDGKNHSEGKVKGMWSAGLVLETDIAPAIGSPVALVVLSGGFDGERLAAQVAGIEKNTLLLDLLGLDTARWARLQALVDGTKPAVEMPFTPLATQPQRDAPVFIISGGEDDLGEPTGSFPLPVQTPPPAPVQAAPSAFEVPSPLDRFHDDSMETQLVELGRRNTQLADENARLQAEIVRLGALKGALEEELKDALARLDAIEKSLRR